MPPLCNPIRHPTPRSAAALAAPVLLLQLTLFAPAASAQAVVPRIGAFPAGVWEGPYDWPVIGVHSALLPSGEVLHYSYPQDGTGAEAWVFNPYSYTFYESPVDRNIFCGGHAFLPDGRLLVAGGTGGFDPVTGLLDTHLFDVSTGAWTRVEDMAVGRFYPTCLTLADGRTLALSGLDELGQLTTLVETYTAGSGWSPIVGAEKFLELYPRLHLLSDGEVFVAGPGQDSEVLNPYSGSWTFVGSMQNGPRYEGCSVQVPPELDRFLATGGAADGVNATASTELFDFSAPEPGWLPGPALHFARLHHNATILADGSILIVGGEEIAESKPPTPVFPAEIFDPETMTFRVVAPVTRPRLYHSTATLLVDGRVIVAGGDGEQTVEIFWPPYMFRPRPLITSAPGAVSYGSEFSVSYSLPGGIGGIQRAALFRLTATTHSVSMDQRYVPLEFDPLGGATLAVSAPAHGGIAPPGFYMLVLISAKDQPSPGWILHLG